MTVAGRSRLLLLLVPVILGVMILVGPSLLGAGARAGAQTNPTGPPVTTVALGSSTTAASAGDAASTRTVNRIVAVLITFAVVLVWVAIWFWRATKPVPRHLDALDLMATRRWREGGSAQRSALLAPVHERRGDERDDDIMAEPEVVAAEAGADAEEEPRAS